MFDQTEIGLKASMGQYSTGQLATGDGIKSLSFLGPQKDAPKSRPPVDKSTLGLKRRYPF